MRKGIKNQFMAADKGYEVGRKVKHIDEIPDGIQRSNLHLIIQEPVQPQIHKDEKIRKHGYHITEAHNC